MSGIHHAPQEGSFDELSTIEGTVRVVREGGTKTLYLDAPGMSDDDRATHWLSADAEAFVGLDEMR